MTSLDSRDRERLASRMLAVSADQVQTNQLDLPEQSATYFWQSGRGGGALIVGSDGSVLFANSSVTLDTHVEAFAAGRRTDPALFTGEET